MKKAAEILARLLEKGPAGAPPFHALFGGWQEIAGPSLAEHCRAYEVRHHSLLVEADHPGWMQLLLMQKKAILARIRQRFPQLELRDIRVRVGGAKPAMAAPKPAMAAGSPLRRRAPRRTPRRPGPRGPDPPLARPRPRLPAPKPSRRWPRWATRNCGRSCACCCRSWSAGLTLPKINKYTPLSYSIRENYL